jgi:putative membrane protein
MESTPGRDAGDASRSGPGSGSDASPGSGSGASPGSSSGTSPGSSSGTSPGSTSGTSPGSTSGTSPGSTSGTSPRSSSGEPDYRFTLANERTFLAYVRTALALDAAGVAVMQFLTTVESERVRRLIGIVLTVAGIGASIGAYYRWRANVRAMRKGAPLPPTLLPVGLALAALVVSLAAIYLVAFG